MARPYRARRWRWAGADPALALGLAESLGISPVLAQVLVARGYADPEAAREFLDPRRDRLLDPLQMKDMDRAVGLIRERVAARQPVLVYGDYDVDGLVGTAVLVTVLRRLGVPVEYYIPNRFTEGYGLNRSALDRARAAGFDFILTVDTGISAVAEAAAARELGITLVITDHHEPGPMLPAAAAVVNPKRPDCPYPFKGLSGAGVAFKLAQALLGPGDPLLDELLDMVALATVADLVPLVGENRILVREGLARLEAAPRPGLAALKRVAGLGEDRPVTAWHLAFALGPRVNALGRMGDARVGVELFLTEDPDRALEIARRLDRENQARQQVEQRILQEAMAQLAAQPPEDRAYAAVLAGEGWHHGVVGIVASRVVEATYRPAVLLAIEGDEARGSARSIPGFHIYRALCECRDLLEKFGGHAMAAGMTLKARNVPALRERLNRLVREWLSEEDLVPALPVDGLVPGDQITPELVAELARLEPYGLGNPGPRLVTRGELLEGRAVGDGTHLKFRLRTGGQVLDGIGFGLAAPGAPGAALPPAPVPVQVAFTPEINRWNGTERLQLNVTDLQVPGPAEGLEEYALLTLPRLLAWDPLAGVEAAADPGPLPRWVPLAEAQAAGAADREVAAGTEPGLSESMPAQPGPALAQDPSLAETDPDPEAAAPDPAAGEPDPAAGPGAPGAAGAEDGLFEAIARLGAGGRVLVLVASPWAMLPVAGALRPLLTPAGGQVCLWWPGESCPGGGAEEPGVVVTTWGQPLPEAAFAAAVALHPPYHLAQAAALARAVRPGGPVCRAWEPHHWALLERTLAWPYPGRPELVEVFRLLRAAGGARSLAEWADLWAARGREPLGPWNRLRIWAAVRIFEELGLAAGLDADRIALTPAASGIHGKMNLSDSPRYRRGTVGRMFLGRCRDALCGAPGPWPAARAPA